MRELLTEPFNLTNFKQLISGLVPFEFYDQAKLVSTDSNIFESVENIGTFHDNRFHNILVIKHTVGVGARVKLATETFRLMAANNIDAALVAYYSEKDTYWRISLVTLSLEEDRSGKIAKIYSNPRRYSYTLGPTAKTATPFKFLISKGVTADFDDLVSRFSVEVVNNEFYKAIAKLYDELVGTDDAPATIRYPEAGEASHQFAVRLIGRIVFCWFLREKHSSNGIPLISKDILSRNAAEQDGYYHQTLAPLFFEILNKPIPKRSERFQQGEFGKVPYLNGGLFADQDDDHYKYDKNTDKSVLDLVDIPNDWLQKLFDLLELYHFTVDENTSIDIDLSIDPEMLGRIFENLLARINPETGETVRNATGSYYTPREIVDYMANESLVEYLGQTHIHEDKLRSLVSYGTSDDISSDLNEGEKNLVIKALHSAKILDPACGSGAFPIGVLQKIVFVLQRIDPEAKLWFQNQIAHTAPEFRELVEREFRYKNFDYIRKLGIIRESIFGVDIQPIATEIARLRCFLTLIVDERVNDEEENRGVYPLPNLDFKFVTANTLVKLDVPKTATAGQTGFFEDRSGIDELKYLRDDYFNSHNSERDGLKFKFLQAQNRMLQNIIKSQSKGLADTTQKLSSWDPFSNKMTDWFDPEWMFGIDSGFDIVIANPPYIDSESMSKNNPEFRKLLSHTYSTAKGNWDIFVVFIELGLQLLSKSGTLSYIVPNKLIGARYTETLREYMQTKCITSIRDYSRYKVFKEADIYPVVFVCSNNPERGGDISFTTISAHSVTELTLSNEVTRDVFNVDIYWDKYFLPPNILKLLLKISDNPKLEKFCKQILGAATVSEAYEFKKYILNYDDLSSSSVSYKRFLNTGTIDPYFDTWSDGPTQYIKSSYTKPVLQDVDIEKVNSKRLVQAMSEKLVIAGMSKSPECIYDPGDVIAGKSTSIILTQDLMGIHPFVLQSIINSSLIAFWFSNYFKSLAMAGGYINVNQNELTKIPVANIGNTSSEKIIGLVKELIEDKTKRESNVREINSILYNSYGLTKDDVSTIEEYLNKA